MGYNLLAIVLVWCLLAGITYWALVSGSASMKEEVKYKVVEDDKPVSQ